VSQACTDWSGSNGGLWPGGYKNHLCKNPSVVRFHGKVANVFSQVHYMEGQHRTSEGPMYYTVVIITSYNSSRLAPLYFGNSAMIQDNTDWLGLSGGLWPGGYKNHLCKNLQWQGSMVMFKTIITSAAQGRKVEDVRGLDVTLLQEPQRYCTLVFGGEPGKHRLVRVKRWFVREGNKSHLCKNPSFVRLFGKVTKMFLRSTHRPRSRGCRKARCHVVATARDRHHFTLVIRW
jgi:hypothetical protein